MNLHKPRRRRAIPSVLLFGFAALAIVFSVTSSVQASASYSPLGMYQTSVNPDYQTYVVSRPDILSELTKVVTRLSSPRTVLYFPDVNPAELTSVTSGLDVRIDKWLPAQENERVVSFITVQDNGRKVIGVMGFVNHKPAIAEALDYVTQAVNEAGVAQFDAAASAPAETITRTSELTTAAVDPDGPLPSTDSYYNPSSGISTGPVYTTFWWSGNPQYVAGRSKTYFTCKWLWNDHRDAYDYVAIHAKSQITPGYILDPTEPQPGWRFYDQILCFQPGTNVIDQSYQDLATTRPNTGNTSNDQMSVSSIGWSPYPGYLSWSYTFHGMAHYDEPAMVTNLSVGSPPGPTEFAQWRHSANFMDAYNGTNVISIEPGWNQTVKQNQPLKVVLVPGAGQGSYCSWNIGGNPVNAPTFSQAMNGQVFSISKPGY